LSGKVAAAEVLFFEGRMQRVLSVYQKNPRFDYFNDSLCDVLIAYVNERIERDPQTKLRILEVGAGTGATSARVFQRLEPLATHVEEYCYTDISRTFLLHAQKEYAPRAPYLTCKLFNAEIAPSRQSIDSDSFDIVIAANSLHATKNIRQRDGK
jgi:polyketide synthase PksN